MAAKSISSIVSFSLMVLFSAICVFHFLALFQVIPFDILWGGRLKTKEEMWVFESISILVNFLMLGVVLIYRGAIQIGISKDTAFMNFNLAPLSARRDFAMFGCIRRAAKLQGPPSLWKFFCRNAVRIASATRRGQRYSLQLIEWPAGRNLELMRRSALGMIKVYNLLPLEVLEKAEEGLVSS